MNPQYSNVIFQSTPRLGRLATCPIVVVCVLSVCLFLQTARAEGVGWRGDGSGRYPTAHAPLRWDIDDGKNILWQTRIGKGQSTPVSTGGRVFVTVEPDQLVCIP